MHWTEYKIT